MSDRYLVVNETTHLIVGGPYAWDGVTVWTPPDPGTLMLEADAFSAGYTWPPPPDVAYVLVDEGSMTIVGGPYSWNGEGDPPVPGVLMPEADALSAGYAYP
jgi:hypothetical protein